MADVSGGGVSLSPGAEVARFSDAQLPLRKVTLNSAGEYRCTVSNPSPNPSVINVPKITRKFRLHVIPRSEGAVIEGEHEVSINAKSGDDLIQTCRVNAEQHRSVTIRWGKTIDMESADVERNPEQEVIRLSNMAFVVFPSVSASEIRSNSDNLPSPVAVSEPGSSESRLLIRKATVRDSGLYICSVLTESGRDDRKLVRVNIKDSQAQGVKDVSANNFPHRLTLYIAAPVAVFLICLCVISYCLISRRTRRSQQLNGNSHTRATLPSGQQRSSARSEHVSAASNNSMAGYRAGVMPPDGSGYPLMKPNGHPHNGCPAVTVTGPHEHYNPPGIMYVPTGMTGVYHDYSGQQATQQTG
ncbi:unnamed protein product [Dibothriocephalus latus]|uniref:Ig-like domain-containing protein n=1 Tax=Dibothriocephalus latus TaxID=60516 RepID=A0A3P6TM34_DIBLA|nr:unnamed protein product [Dibothriocephalus latus]